MNQKLSFELFRLKNCFKYIYSFFAELQTHKQNLKIVSSGINQCVLSIVRHGQKILVFIIHYAQSISSKTTSWISCTDISTLFRHFPNLKSSKRSFHKTLLAYVPVSGSITSKICRKLREQKNLCSQLLAGHL